MTTTKRGGPRPGQPMEGYLIEVAREARGYSQRECGRRIGITGTRWAALVNGTRRTSAGRAVQGGAEVFGRMARAVGLFPESFDECRPDIAAEMRQTAFLYTDDKVTEAVPNKLNKAQVVGMLLHVRGMTDEDTWLNALQDIGLLPHNDTHTVVRKTRSRKAEVRLERTTGPMVFDS